ncbi:2-dehydro-3-deoxyglucarate aldolase [Fibrella sp. HMF5335]|uniref:2-dehydro-3-deoxyglucarate aldolase n=1 Tax=Fibrella rubiginis TaxID=2817060 RepID=A0A939GKL6_9BACT|nr:aldolase/citrate lyase family protein [Fibrella rubiginis]MBO0938466.1 2-dehydro-3-deoxyglucarate aldolase [Fibrella rubiginis]
MPSQTPFTQKLREARPLLGTLISLSAPEVSEMLSLAGFDWLFIDMEHSTLAPADVQRHLQAIRGDCNGLVRVAENNPVLIQQALDLGADGVIIPAVSTAQEARQAVQWANYPPTGNRSVGIGRAQEYGLTFADYVANANDTVAVIIQVEHIDAVHNLNEILAVPGIDGVFIGPYDLSGSLNHLGDVHHPDVQAAIQTVKTSCANRHVPVGIFTRQPDAIAAEIASGTRFIAVGTDASFIWQSGKAIVDRFRDAV